MKLEDFIDSNWKLLPKDKVVILLDGLDEIEPINCTKIKRIIGKFSLDYPKVIIIVSCRTNFYNTSIIEGGGTLKGFSPFYISKLSIDDVKKYVYEKHDIDGELFIQEIYGNAYSDLVLNPFFLKLFIDYYLKNKNILTSNRSKLLRSFIESRFERDKVHFEETLEDVEEDKEDAYILLKEISLTMEIVGVKIVDDNNLKIIIPKKENRKIIKYFTLFNKKENNGKQWMFEHKYFQEYLCAELLSKQSFKVIKSFICYKGYDKINPIWLNTLSLLINILEQTDKLFIDLTQWLFDSEPGLLVNIEKEKLSLEFRNRILNLLFESSKRLNIWIDSNKFSIEDLSILCQTDNNIDYIIKEIKDKSNTEIVRENALHILRYFNTDLYKGQYNIKDILIEILQEVIDNPNLAFSVINAFTYSNSNDKDTVNKVFLIAGKNKTQYVRASMYKYIQSSIVFEDYIDYFLEGYSLLDNKDEERDEVNLMDESFNLKEGIRRFRTYDSLSKIFEVCIHNNRLESEFEKEELLKEIINNSIKLYSSDSRIYKCVLSLFRHCTINWNYRLPDIILVFFVETNTKQKAFEDALMNIRSNKDVMYEIILFSNLIDLDNYTDIVASFDRKIIDEDSLKKIYWRVRNINQDLSEKLRCDIKKKTNYVIECPVYKDWNTINMSRIQKSFDLLFNLSSFILECERIFDDKEELSWNELWGLRENSNDNIELNDIYLESALGLLRNFSRNDKLANKINIIAWLNSGSNFEWYMIKECKSYINNNKNLLITEEQIEVLKQWFDKNIDIIDFKNSITSSGDKTYNINNYSIYLMFLMKRFEFKCTESKYIDILSSTIELPGETMRFDDIIELVNDKDKLKERIILNIEDEELAYFDLYENHVKYIFKNKLEKVYPTIMKNMIGSNYEYYDLEKIINLYFEFEIDIKYLKGILPKLGKETIIYIVDKLIKVGDIEFSKNILLELFSREQDKEKKRVIFNHLTRCKEEKALDFIIDWVLKYKISPFDYTRSSIAYYTDIAVLPKFMELLKISYEYKIYADIPFYDFRGMIFNGIEYLALSNEDNFNIVIGKMETFLERNIDKYENIGFLKNIINNIKESHYKTKIIKYSFSEAKKMIDKLEK
jgi:hypothetical protein